jgi:hypothetical protein
MFPHEFDRYRVMGFLLRQARDSIRVRSESAKQPKKLTQTALAERIREKSRIGGVSQPSISNFEGLESLDRLFQGGTKPGTREALIEIATLGLRLKQKDVDAVLWLFDQKTLDEDEVEYCQRYDPDFRPVDYQPGEMRAHVFALIDNWLAKRNAKPVRIVKARMIMKWDEPAQLEFREELLKMEKGPGQRMIFGKYPSILNYPHPLGREPVTTEDSYFTEAGRTKVSDLMEERQRIFASNLATYGERCIHSKALISKYLSKNGDHRLTLSQRKEQIENLIDLLQEHDHYEMALVEDVPNSEIVIKSTQAACLRGTESDTYNASNKALICGPLYVYWYDVTTVFSLYRQFERAWDSIPEKLRDKQFVMKFLQDALNSAR